jgi:hypothetical protein
MPMFAFGSPVMQQLQRDKSWRVRYMAADHFCEVFLDEQWGRTEL